MIEKDKTFKVKVQGIIRDVEELFVKANGDYKTGRYIYQKINGAWKLIWELRRPAPVGIISIWSGLVSEIPSGWCLCDGSNGTPDLRGRFIMGSNGNNGAGGTLSHSHTLTSDGVHTHNDLSNDNSHRHGGSFSIAGEGSGFYSEQVWSNSQVYTAYNSANHIHTVSYDGNHNHGGLNTSSSIEPPFYTLAFIMKLS